MGITCGSNSLSAAWFIISRGPFVCCLAKTGASGARAIPEHGEVP